MVNNEEIRITEVVKFFYKKKLIIFISVLFTLFCTFAISYYDLGKNFVKANVKVNISNHGISKELFLFNDALKRLVYAGDLSQYLESASSLTELGNFTPSLSYEYIEKLDLLVDAPYMIRAISRFRFDEEYDGEITGFVKEIEENKITFSIQSKNHDLILNVKENIENKLYDLVRFEITSIYYDAVELHKVMKKIYLGEMENYNEKQLNL